MKIYLAGPMRGYPEFNYPAFMKAAYQLRREGHEVFNPAEKDIERHKDPNFAVGTKGDLTELEEKGFDLRRALFDDLEYICKEADAIALLPGWHLSRGVAAELATATALGLKVIAA